MEIATKVIELTGVISPDRQLVLDEKIPVSGPTRVRVIIFFSEEGEAGEAEWLRAAASNPVFDFLKDSAEDVYTLADGRPFSD